MVIKIKLLREDAKLPEYQTGGAAGIDLRANFDKSNVAGGIKSPPGDATFVTSCDQPCAYLYPGKRCVIPTGIAIQLPQGYEAQVRSRSGLAINAGVVVLNSPGTIDSDYRGEIGVILINHSDETFVIKDGDRIAQLVINKVEQVDLWEQVSELDSTARNAGGYGSTGSK